METMPTPIPSTNVNRSTGNPESFIPVPPSSIPLHPYRFDFGTGPAEPGATKILPATAYNSTTGYGFADTNGLVAITHEDASGRKQDFITSNKPFTFYVDLPYGNYDVTVMSGNSAGTSAATVKAQFGRIVLNKVTTEAHQLTEQTFTVNVANGRLGLQFSGRNSEVDSVVVVPTRATTVFLAGDSTVCDQPPLSDPFIGYGGWGQMLSLYFKPGVAIANYAASGRTAISFINEGRLTAILSVIQPDDYLFIQFGHNDEHEGSGSYPFTTYKAALKQYVDGARQHHALPVLVTPVARRQFDSDSNVIDSHGDYALAMRQLAVEEHVQLIDLTALSLMYFQSLGPEGTKSVLFFLDPGVSPDFPDGVQDNTHFSVDGSIRVASLVAGAIRSEHIEPLAHFLK